MTTFLIATQIEEIKGQLATLLTDIEKAKANIEAVGISLGDDNKTEMTDYAADALLGAVGQVHTALGYLDAASGAYDE